MNDNSIDDNSNNDIIINNRCKNVNNVYHGVVMTMLIILRMITNIYAIIIRIITIIIIIVDAMKAIIMWCTVSISIELRSSKYQIQIMVD